MVAILIFNNIVKEHCMIDTWCLLKSILWPSPQPLYNSSCVLEKIFSLTLCKVCICLKGQACTSYSYLSGFLLNVFCFTLSRSMTVDHFHVYPMIFFITVFETEFTIITASLWIAPFLLFKVVTWLLVMFCLKYIFSGY